MNLTEKQKKQKRLLDISFWMITVVSLVFVLAVRNSLLGIGIFVVAYVILQVIHKVLGISFKTKDEDIAFKDEM